MSRTSVDIKTYNKEYRAFHDAKQRCTNPNHQRYPDWGGRGIVFGFSSFNDFLKEIGPSPHKYSLDRKDNDAGYISGNVRWATRSEQQLNKRAYKKSPYGISGVRKVKAKGLVTPTYQSYVNKDGKFLQLYCGPSLEQAISIRKEFNEKTNQSKFYFPSGAF